MATVTRLASHLLSLLQPQNSLQPASHLPNHPEASGAVPSVDAARLAFYHFLKNMCEPGEPLSTATLDRFFRRSLTHAHWVENKTALFNEVANSLQHFSNQHGEAVPLPPFPTAADLQVVRAESFRSLERVVDDWIQSHQGPTDQIKILRDRDEKLLVCKLSVDRSFSVHIFDRLLALREGRLEPLTDDMAVHYNADLRIDPYRLSQIEIAPHSIARFRNEHATGSQMGGIRGLAVRGFTFQKSTSFDGGELHRHPLLFYPLKRIEQFFVNRQTDPMYIELTGLLEKAADLLTQKHPEALRFAEAAMERGRLAFEQVFIEDRFLRLLLENLERAVQLERRPFESRSHSEAAAVGPLGPAPSMLPSSTFGVDLEGQVGDKIGGHLGLRLNPGEEFIEPSGPDLVELQETHLQSAKFPSGKLSGQYPGQHQEAEACETIVPINGRAP